MYEKSDGTLEFDVGDAKEIREKYKKKDEEGFGFDKGKQAEKRKGRTTFSASIYRFETCISECFEPYL